METNIVVDISPPIPHLAKFWFSSYEPKCWQPMKLQDSLKCNISRKKWMMKFVFGMQINIEVFYKLILSFWVCPTRLAQSTQNKNFAYLCNISRTARRGGGWRGLGEVDFLPANKHKSFLQVDGKNWVMKLIFSYADKLATDLYYDFDGDGEAFPNFPCWYFSWR